MSTHALIATARYHGDVTQERFEPGEAVEIGGRPPLALPLPGGLPWLARVDWLGASTARVTDPRGQQYVLDVDEVIEMQLGEVQLDLELTPQFTLKRTDPFPWKLSTGWLSVVLMFTIFTSWLGILQERRCELFAVTPELAVRLGCVQTNGGDVTQGLPAEYLERLLRQDYAGEKDGVITRKEHEDKGEKTPSFYMPAGNRGPKTNMGGAEDVADEAIRAPRSESLPEPEPKPKPKPKPVVPVAPEGVGTVIEAVADQDEEGTAEDDAGADAEKVDQPAEKEQGWGLQDWYDERDAVLDQLEIEQAKHLAHRRLRIDPNDPAALSLLSYYQYLDEDYVGAEKTYDKYIDLLPDDAAGYNNKALIYKRLKQWEKEESLYRVALSLEPLDVTALNNLGVNLAHQKRFDEAIAVMQQLELLDPGEPYAELHRAKIYAEKGDDERAYAYLRSSLEGMAKLDTLHHIEFRQDIRLDPSFARLRETQRFRAILLEFYGKDTPLQE